MWDEQFEQILRAHLPFLGPDEELGAQSGLRDLGLDSLATVELLGALESAYGVQLVDEALTLQTFATPASVWSALTASAALA